MFFHSKNKAECCGCRACEQKCPKTAIQMIEDSEGFIYPEINKDECVECKLCEKVCPMENHSFSTIKPLVYAAVNINEENLAKSSSGGMFTVIAEEIIRNSGSVYGAAFNSDLILTHKRINTIQGLKDLRGSKYLQSDIGNTYKEIKNDLISGLYVYFVGTPCQVGGLMSFLGKSYENLVTSDLVCHGVPSQKIFNNTIKNIEKSKTCKVVNYFFRDKRVKGWNCSSSSEILRKGKTKLLKYDNNMNAYFNAFMSGDIMRWSCYSCPFAQNNRVGDITLADYWGIDKYHSEFEVKKGVSLVLLNSKKGIKFWNAIKTRTHSVTSDIRNAEIMNSNLRMPTANSSKRKGSYDLNFKKYDLFLDTYLPKNRLKHKLFFMLDCYLGKYPKVFAFLQMLYRKSIK